MNITNNIYLEWIPDTINYRLAKDYCRIAYYEKDTYDIYIPKGFETDLASIPQLFWGVYRRDGKYLPASIVHDFLYSTNYLSRKTADKIFYNLMLQDEVDIFTRNLFYSAVRSFGWLCYKKKQRDRYTGGFARKL